MSYPKLRQYDIGDYALRAIDLKNSKNELFNCPLIRRDQYTFARSSREPDVFNGREYTYQILLNPTSRTQFQEILRTCLEEFLIVNDTNQNSTKTHSREFIHVMALQEDKPYYTNDEPFDCIVCLDTISKDDGIRFRNCLHLLCKSCLLRLIETSDEPSIKCPHDNCTELIEERELRGVVNDLKVDQKVLDRLHNVSVRFAESRNKTFHCITPDCTHWWFIEPEQDNNIIFCDGCQHWICLACSVIHEGQTCAFHRSFTIVDFFIEYVGREYQEEKKLQQANEDNLRNDTAHLEAMIKNKEAMYWTIAPTRVHTQQPASAFGRPISNSFGLLPSEKVYREWDYKDNVCCCSNGYYTVLTDIRLLTRYQEYVCCAGCSEPSHTDSAIFLHDIDQMRECRGEQPTFFFLLWITLICAWPCYAVRRVFCPKPKCLEVFGSFGSEVIRIKKEDMPVAQVDISTAVINTKLVGRS
ncbi:unnamed protein product [Adineta ricciae]|uniref:RING-type domain-containing protein n=1 Tax=Adineta ricciae TaxID=249248 RepID=A0A815C341_ADIRI|nr:unnamed protein product [Adineta ricciae]